MFRNRNRESRDTGRRNSARGPKWRSGLRPKRREVRIGREIGIFGRHGVSYGRGWETLWSRMGSQWRRLRNLPMRSVEFRMGVFRLGAKGGREIEFCAGFRYGQSRASGPAPFARLGNEGQMGPRMFGEATTKKAPRTIKPIGRAADVRVYYDACSTDG